MNNFIRQHVFSQLFVACTAAAAIVHSTWSIGTLFSGVQPDPTIDLLNRFPDAIHFLGWIVPAFLVALSLDIGQVKTASEIKAGERHFMKFATFAIFAVATYYLQWFYLTEHTPQLVASQGIRAEWRNSVQLLRDLSLWLIPLLLPLSTIMYTFSDRKTEHQHLIPVVMPVETVLPVIIENELPLLTPGDVISEVGVMLPPAKVVMSCPNCDWTKEYDDLKSAESGLRMHQRRYCVVTPVAISNGHSHG